MSKAEEKALEAYPENIKELWGPLPGAEKPSIVDDNLPYRTGFIEGYEQAMKDAEERIRNWELDFDDHYLTFDKCGYARIMQTDLEEDMINVIKGEEYTK